MADSEPLIEKRDVPRILIDGSANISNYHLVESFIELINLSAEIDVWCLYDGELKSWMKPDFKISSIPANELTLYLDSVDGVVITGDEISVEHLSNYISAGILPIVIDSNTVESIDKLVSVEAIRGYHPEFGSLDLLRSLCLDTRLLTKYSNLASEVERADVYFDFAQFEESFLATDDIAAYLDSKLSIQARKEYLSAKYGDPNGSPLHKQIALDLKIAKELEGEPMRVGKITGWTLDTESLTICSPLVLGPQGPLEILIKRHDRHDVIEYFDITDVADIGYEAEFLFSPAEVDEEKLIYSVEADDSHCAQMFTLVSDLDMSIQSADLNHTSYDLVDNNTHQGSVETIEFKDALSFDTRLVNSNLTPNHICLTNTWSKNDQVSLVALADLSDEDDMVCVAFDKQRDHTAGAGSAIDYRQGDIESTIDSERAALADISSQSGTATELTNGGKRASDVQAA